MYSVDCCPKGLVIGKQGENEAEKIAIDFSPWASEFGAGTISARLRRPKDSAAYPVALITEGTTATWTISATDTQYAGAGSLQLVYIVGDVVAKSVIWPVRVLPSLEAGEAPEPYESWLDTLEGLAADTQGNARDAAASAADAAQSATSAAASAQDAAESAASITGLTAVAETLPEGSEASASFDGATDTLTLGIPKGDTGAAGPKGDTGSAGADGFSPTIAVTEITGGHEVSVTDAEGTQTFNVMDGVSPVLDDEVTEDSANGVKSSGIYDAIVNLLPVDTASGSIASFPDGANDVPMLSLKAHIEPVQEGSGDPSPTNVRPISGHTGVKVERCGVNIWDEQTKVGTFDNTTGAYNPDRTDITCTKTPIKVTPSTSYYLAFPSGVTGGNVYFYDSNMSFLSVAFNNANRVVTTPSGCEYVNISFGSIYGPTYNNNISFNYPSSETAYLAYQGETIPVSWESEAGTVYGGELDVVSGVLTVDRAMVDLGTLNWTYFNIEGHYRFAAYPSGIKNFSSNAIANIVCSNYPIDTANNVFSNVSDKRISSGGGALLVFDSSYTDATAFKTAMNGVQLVYELAQPIEYTLTPQEVRTLLGTNNIWSDTGDTEVTYRADIAKYIEKKVNG